MRLIDFKLEQIEENKVIIHRRILAPWFQYRLKSVEAEFKEFTTPLFHFPFIGCVVAPPGYLYFVGHWTVSKYSEDLNLIKKPYHLLKKREV